MRCWAQPRWATSACIFQIRTRAGRLGSILFLRHARDLAVEAGYRIVNVDSTVILERPKLKDYRLAIRERLAAALEIEVERVSVKFKTAEGVDLSEKAGLRRLRPWSQLWAGWQPAADCQSASL